MKNSKSQTKQGFSLLEVSIVIAVIALLVVGVIAGKSMIKNSMINSARGMTLESPVKDMSGLTVWLESTAKKSFIRREATNGQTVSLWINISPESGYDNNAIAISGSGPEYIDNVLNGLPVLRFDGSKYLIGASAGVAGSSGSSVIVVFRCFSSSSDQDVFSFGESSSPTAGKRKRIDVGGNSGWRFNNGNRLFSERFVIDRFHISSWISADGADYGSHERYIDGVISTGSSSSNSSSIPDINDAEYAVGKGRNNSGGLSYEFSGDIAEIIVFNRQISDLERKNIENYLSDKWKIKI